MSKLVSLCPKFAKNFILKQNCFCEIILDTILGISTNTFSIAILTIALINDQKVPKAIQIPLRHIPMKASLI